MTENAQNDKTMQTTIDYWRETRALVLFHETYHWENTVSIPRCKDIAYEPYRVVKMAQTDEENAKLNAESWTEAAMAIYLQKTFGLSSPPTALPAPSPLSSASATVDGDDIVTEALDAPPDGWIEPVSTSSTQFLPDMTNTTWLSDVGALVTGLDSAYVYPSSSSMEKRLTRR
jgi:hypothetical protein